jgi:CHASE3 domain sensor protein
VLVAVSVSSVVLVNMARSDNSAVVHTVEVEGQISSLLLEIRRAESAARGYLLTSAPQFLAEHQAAVAVIPPEAAKEIELGACW